MDFSWLEVDAFDEEGRPRHHRGVSVEPGLYFLGLPWLSRRASSFLFGVWHDARYLGGPYCHPAQLPGLPWVPVVIASHAMEHG